MASGEQIGLSGPGVRPGVRLVIVADDLTGALDAAAPFADRGLRVRVATCAAALSGVWAGADVVAVSTRSREVSPVDARQAVVGVLAMLPAGLRVFKKVDSRLKGNIAAELAAFPAGPVLAVPALPEFGRVVRADAVCGFGVAHPIAVAAAIGRGCRVPDVETPDDMAQALKGSGDALIVGARGAAVALAGQMAAGRATLPALELPMVIAVGSTDPITLAQVARLQDMAGLRVIAAPDGVAPVGPKPGVTLIQALPGAGQTGIGQTGALVAAALAETVAGAAVGAATLVLTGGATAEAVLDRLGIRVLDLHGDLQPGLPLSSGGAWRIVTKSGGFGDAGALLRLATGTGAAAGE
jgi:D-threonate/D-erythronate kinase